MSIYLYIYICIYKYTYIYVDEYTYVYVYSSIYNRTDISQTSSRNRQLRELKDIDIHRQLRDIDMLPDI